MSQATVTTTSVFTPESGTTLACGLPRLLPIPPTELGVTLALAVLLDATVIRMMLVPSLLGRIEAKAGRIDGNAVGIADAGGVALGGREFLARLVGVVAPDASPRVKLRARLVAGDVGHAVLSLAGIGGGGDIDEEVALGIDGEGVHRMVAGERQA